MENIIWRNVMKELYPMIFNRKSFRRFKSTELLSHNTLNDIKDQLSHLKPLINHITVKYKIMKREETTCTRGEYCLLVYSENKEHYLLNIGYLLEQLDLWMASKGIGVCWYGVGKTDQVEYEGLEFVIMLAFGKGEKEEFRKDYTKAKRKPLEEIWQGNSLQEVANVVRYAPSTCNTQPWLIEIVGNQLNLYRDSKKRGMMPESKVIFYNTIDMGIFMCFLEITLGHERYDFNRTLLQENLGERDQVQIAQYTLNT